MNVKLFRSTISECGEVSVTMSGIGTRQRLLVRCSAFQAQLRRCMDQGEVSRNLFKTFLLPCSVRFGQIQKKCMDVYATSQKSKLCSHCNKTAHFEQLPFTNLVARAFSSCHFGSCSHSVFSSQSLHHLAASRAQVSRNTCDHFPGMVILHLQYGWITSTATEQKTVWM